MIQRLLSKLFPLKPTVTQAKCQAWASQQEHFHRTQPAVRTKAIKPVLRWKREA